MSKILYYNESIREVLYNMGLKKKCVTLTDKQVEMIDKNEGINFSDKLRRILDEFAKKECD